MSLVWALDAPSVNKLLSSFLSCNVADKRLAVPHLFHLRSGYCAPRPRTIDARLYYTSLLHTESAKRAAIFFAARLYAAQLDVTCGKLPTSSCLPFKVAAIQEIRRVVDQLAIVSDGDIVAVIFLAMSFNKVPNHLFVT